MMYGEKAIYLLQTTSIPHTHLYIDIVNVIIRPGD